MAEIDPSGKSHGIVDDHDFLMLRSSEWMCAVEPKVESRFALRTEVEDRMGDPLECVNDREVKIQNVDVQVRPPVQKRAEKVSQLIRETGTILVMPEQNAMINVPAQNQDTLPGFQRRLLESLIVGFAVNQERHLIGSRSPPAIPPLNKERFLIRFHVNALPGARQESKNETEMGRNGEWEIKSLPPFSPMLRFTVSIQRGPFLQDPYIEYNNEQETL